MVGSMDMQHLSGSCFTPAGRLSGLGDGPPSTSATPRSMPRQSTPMSGAREAGLCGSRIESSGWLPRLNRSMEPFPRACQPRVYAT